MDRATQLLLQAAGGDREALTAYLEACQADVWRFCASMLSPDAADDATQETFVRVWRSLHTFRGEASARTWTLTIARRACFEAIRRRERAERPWRVAPPAATSGDPGNVIALQDLLSGLAPERRAPFVLTQLLGLPYEEAATVIGVPIGTIRSRVARARADLQARLAAADDAGVEPPEPGPGRAGAAGRN